MNKTSVYFTGIEPIYTSSGASGADLFAKIDSSLELFPHQMVLVCTGTYVEIPPGYEGQVRSRSGLSFKHGILVINAPGTIDCDYRGEIKVPLLNISKASYTIEPMDRIAQLIICPVVQVQFCPVKNRNMLSHSDRGEKGFGSSGMQEEPKKT